jgi:hypothetical protein
MEKLKVLNDPCRECLGENLSDCCGKIIVNTDICSQCGEYCETECYDCKDYADFVMAKKKTYRHQYLLKEDGSIFSESFNAVQGEKAELIELASSGQVVYHPNSYASIAMVESPGWHNDECTEADWLQAQTKLLLIISTLVNQTLKNK